MHYADEEEIEAAKACCARALTIAKSGGLHRHIVRTYARALFTDFHANEQWISIPGRSLYQMLHCEEVAQDVFDELRSVFEELGLDQKSLVGMVEALSCSELTSRLQRIVDACEAQIKKTHKVY